MRAHPKGHAACHAAHVREWPMHAKVWITWGIQGWVPGVVVGYTKNRVLVRVTGRAQSGADLTFYTRHKKNGAVGRAPNNVAPRRSWGDFPTHRIPPSCLMQSQRSA